MACPATRRARGFVTIFVILILLLMAVLVITYLRTMRLRMMPVTTYAGNPDRVLNSILAKALTEIAADMPVKNGTHEDYDYPWTDASANLLPATVRYPAVLNTNTQGNPVRDDAWLATGYLNGATYPHLTNLFGSFLDVASSDLTRSVLNPSTRTYVPNDRLSAGMENDVALSDPRLVDADGDGVGDSFWFYPPVTEVNNVRYVGACYIEDLSAKVNLNTALPLRSGGAYGSAALRGVHPGEVDLAGTVGPLGATDAELARAVLFRTGDAGAAPWSEAKRQLSWGNRGMRALLQGDPLASDTNRYTSDDEIELRFHGGLNDRYIEDPSGNKLPYVSRVETSASGMPNLLRATNVGSLTERDWSGAGFATAAAWVNTNPRRWLTTMNGECNRQIGVPTGMLSEEVRYNLNIRNDDRYDDALRDWTLCNWFRGPDGLDGSADDYPYPAGFNRFVPAAGSRPLEFARQMHACMMDARDKDNRVTEAWGWYGWENLPMLSEVYMQSHYRVWGATTVSGGTRTVNCDRYWADASYAFEIVNPYAVDVKLTNIHLAVHRPGVWWSGAQRISNWLGGWADRDADNDPVLKPGHTLILWRNAAVQNGETGNDIGAKVTAAVAKDPSKIHAVNAGYTLTDPGQNFDFVRVELICESEDASGGSPTRRDGAYSFITVPWLRHSFTEQTTGSTWDSASNGTNIGYRQVRGRATGLAAGLNILQCRPGQVNNMTLTVPVTGSPTVGGSAAGLGDMEVTLKKATDAYNTTMASTLGDAAKISLPAGRANLSKDQLFFSSGWNSASEGQFNAVADLLRIPAIGFRERAGGNRGNLTNQDNGVYTDTDVAHMVYELLEDGTKPLSSLCFPMDAGAAPYNPDVANSTHRNVPWGWLLHCIYDTVGPAMAGGYDYDGDGVRDWFSSQNNAAKLDANGNGYKDWNGEVDFSGHLVPGRINLNTMPVSLLREVLPVKDPTLRQQLADAIAARRTSAPATGTRASTDRGMSSLVELLPDAAMLANYPNRPGSDVNGDSAVDYKDVSRFNLAGDFGFLGNVGSCRSDFFAVHMIVQGYRNNDFTSGVVESQRMLAIVSRSAVTSAGNNSQLKTWVYKY